MIVVVLVFAMRVFNKVIALSDVDKCYAPFHALKHCDLTILSQVILMELEHLVIPLPACRAANPSVSIQGRRVCGGVRISAVIKLHARLKSKHWRFRSITEERTNPIAV